MDKERFCKHCGKKVEIENAVFCTGCGKRLDEKKPVSVIKVALIVFAALLLITGIGAGLYYVFSARYSDEEYISDDDDTASLKPTKHADKPTPEPTEEVIPSVTEEPEPAPTETPEPTQEIANIDLSVPGNDATDADSIHEYKIVIDDVTWEEACRAAADFEGGYLVHINTKEEYDYLIDYITKSGYDKNIFWIGARREDTPALYKWADQKGGLVGGSINSSEYWLDGEPSFYDSDTGTFENYVEMFYSKKSGKWVFNDVQNDVIELLPNYSGKMGYIVEID